MEIYRQSGIPDYISKPFTFQELWRCLLKYLKPLNQIEEEKKSQNAETDFDLEFKKVLQHHFWKNNRDKYNEMIKAIEAGDLELAHRIAHTLKGNAAQLGRTGLHIAAVGVERQLKEGKMLVTEEQFKTLETEFNKYLEELSLLYKAEEDG